MKFIRKFLENKEISEDLRQCFENISDLPGFYLEHAGGFDNSFYVKHTENKFEYDFDLLDEIEESLDRAGDLNLEFNRSWIEPSESKYMSSLISSKKNAIEIDNEYCWQGEIFPDPNKLFFVKYPTYRKCLDNQKGIEDTRRLLIRESKTKSGRMGTELKSRDIKYPIFKEDILYSTSVKSILFLFF